MSRIRDSNVAVSPYASQTCQGHRELQPEESGKTRPSTRHPQPRPAAPSFQTPSLHSGWRRIRNRSWQLSPEPGVETSSR